MSLAAGQLKFFATFIEKELGIVYQASNYYQLETRINEIAKNLEFDSAEKLWEHANQKGISGHFKQMLLDVATNNETSFFRDPKIYTAIKNHVLPSWHEANPDARVFKIWSVASSFGQEPYSLAILLNEYIKANPTFPRFEIWATDISERALERAKEGRYAQLEVQRGLSAVQLVEYFSKKDDDYWYVKPGIRADVRFSKMNLLEIAGVIGTYDLVLCRNVLIYQNNERKKEIVENLRRYISPNGYFILGSAESLLNISNGFNQTIKDGAVYFQKAA